MHRLTAIDLTITNSSGLFITSKFMERFTDMSGLKSFKMHRKVTLRFGYIVFHGLNIEAVWFFISLALNSNRLNSVLKDRCG